VPRYFIQLAYKGTRYHGWQVQENAISVQQKLNEALSVLTGESIETVGAGRTDTGVHAKNYFAHADFQMPIDIIQTIYKLNKILPEDIAIYDVLPVKPGAHARFDAISRSYEYYILRRKNPFLIQDSYYNYSNLNVNAMTSAALSLYDFTDFSSFSKSNTQVKTNDCKILAVEWEIREELLIFKISANRFLRNMVRAIVGTLIEVGKGNISLEEFKVIIEKKDRKLAGFSVPAAGLYLTDVTYPLEIFDVN